MLHLMEYTAAVGTHALRLLNVLFVGSGKDEVATGFQKPVRL